MSCSNSTLSTTSMASTLTTMPPVSQSSLWRPVSVDIRTLKQSSPITSIPRDFRGAQSSQLAEGCERPLRHQGPVSCGETAEGRKWVGICRTRASPASGSPRWFPIGPGKSSRSLDFAEPRSPSAGFAPNSSCQDRKRIGLTAWTPRRSARRHSRPHALPPASPR